MPAVTSASAAALAEEAGAMQMRGEVAIAQAEPAGLAEARHLLEGVEGLAAQPPALPLVDEAGERVADGVEIGGDVQAPELGVVAGIADDGERGGREQRRQPPQELGRARPTGEGGDPHRGPSGGGARRSAGAAA